MTYSFAVAVRLPVSQPFMSAQPVVITTTINKVEIIFSVALDVGLVFGNALCIRSNPWLHGHWFLRNVNPEVCARILIRVHQFY